MAILQFIDFASTSLVKGKKLNVKTIARNKIETVSTNGVYFPILQRVAGSGCFFHRLSLTQEIDMMYEESRAAVPRDMMALKAMLDPMLIRARRDTITKLIQRALRGTVNVLLTCSLSVPVTIPSCQSYLGQRV